MSKVSSVGQASACSGLQPTASHIPSVRSSRPEARRRLKPALLAAILFPTLLSAQEWRFYAGDAGGTKYSPLKEINRENVQRLRPAWIFHTGDVSDGTRWPTRSAFEATPLVVDGVMYVTTPFSRVIALDPETGKELWSFDPRLDRTDSANLFINRGAAFWSDGTRKRVFLGTLDGRLFSIRAESGKLDDSFGTGGWVDLRKGVADDFPDKRYRHDVASAGLQEPGHLRIAGAGWRAARSGGRCARLRHHAPASWSGPSTPSPSGGEFGNDTWATGSWQNRGGVNAWSILSVDLERGILFLPLTSPGNRFLRRRSQRRRPVRRFAGRARRRDRQAPLAFPDRASQSLGLRSSRAARAGAGAQERQADRRRGAGDQDGLHVRVRSRDRRAGVSDRRGARGEERSSGRRAPGPRSRAP